MRGPTQSARAALWVRGAPSARTRAKCVGRDSIARAALSARAAIAWRGGWAALSTHLPRTCHSMPTQCNCGSTRVGRDEPQSLGTLRVNGWDAVSDLCLIFFYLSQKFKHDLWRLKWILKLSQKQHLTHDHFFRTTDLGSLQLGKFGASTTDLVSGDVSDHGPSFGKFYWKFYHGTFMSNFYSQLFYRVVSSFASNCPCGVWCRG